MNSGIIIILGGAGFCPSTVYKARFLSHPPEPRFFPYDLGYTPRKERVLPVPLEEYPPDGTLGIN